MPFDQDDLLNTDFSNSENIDMVAEQEEKDFCDDIESVLDESELANFIELRQMQDVDDTMRRISRAVREGTIDGLKECAEEAYALADRIETNSL